LSIIRDISEDFYQSINDLPVWNWNEIKTTGELKWLSKNGKKVGEKDLWDDIQQEYLDVYGIDNESKIYYDKIQRKTLLEADFIITKERFLLNEIRILEAEIKELQGGEKVRFTSICASLSEYLGYRFDPKVHTVAEYKEHLINIEKRSVKKPKEYGE